MRIHRLFALLASSGSPAIQVFLPFWRHGSTRRSPFLSFFPSGLFRLKRPGCSCARHGRIIPSAQPAGNNRGARRQHIAMLVCYAPGDYLIHLFSARILLVYIYIYMHRRYRQALVPNASAICLSLLACCPVSRENFSVICVIVFGGR